MSKRIIIRLPNNKIRLRTPAGPRLPGEQDVDYHARIGAQNLPNGATILGVVDEADIPYADREFREAWEMSGASVAVNMDKARTIHMDKIRRQRNIELMKKDSEFQQALGKWVASDAVQDKASVNSVEQERQVLRDIPQTFDLSVFTTTVALKNAWPAGLPKPGEG